MRIKYDSKYEAKNRAGHKTIEPITPKWDPRLRGSSQEISTLVCSSTHYMLYRELPLALVKNMFTI
jgi:hypothetical protein